MVSSWPNPCVAAALRVLAYSHHRRHNATCPAFKRLPGNGLRCAVNVRATREIRKCRSVEDDGAGAPNEVSLRPLSDPIAGAHRPTCRGEARVGMRTNARTAPARLSDPPPLTRRRDRAARQLRRSRSERSRSYECGRQYPQRPGAGSSTRGGNVHDWQRGTAARTAALETPPSSRRSNRHRSPRSPSRQNQLRASRCGNLQNRLPLDRQPTHPTRPGGQHRRKTTARFSAWLCPGLEIDCTKSGNRRVFNREWREEEAEIWRISTPRYT